MESYVTGVFVYGLLQVRNVTIAIFLNTGVTRTFQQNVLKVTLYNAHHHGNVSYHKKMTTWDCFD